MVFLRSQVKQYVLLFEGRTGSTFLTETLALHPEVLAEVERLREMKKAGHTAAAQLEWARRFLTPALVGPYRVRGFKTKLRDVLDPAALAELLRERRVRVLLLLRRNRIKSNVSYFTGLRLSQETNNWNLYSEADRQGPMRIEVPDFDAALKAREEWDRALEAYAEALRLPTLTLFYEDLLNDQAAFLNRAYSFLGVRTLPVRAHSKKNTSDDLRQVLINFEELRAHYAGTAYEAMFDEVLVPAHS